ncbi:MAG TPA: DEAD/DEAH box helicase [Candidatus Baltobacteraceae bacterium]|nr:DEAD/DEAH box helicase [Candidatus Baltobacteraceae bacterium]
MTFDSLGLCPTLLRAVRDLGFSEPTPIQEAAIPPALAGRDILGSASTGSGKSAAFGLPLIQRLLELPRGTTRALILAPTRELTQQICAHLTALSKHTDLRIAAVYGGVGFGPQITAFKRGTDIIVATPGRLLDHLSQGTASLKNVSFLILDEADRMLDMGFLPVVRRILKQIPGKRQTLFFSATIPSAVGELSGDMLQNPVRVNLTPTTAPATSITQTIYSIDQQRKVDLLLELLKDNSIFSAITFTRTKARTNRLAAVLAKHGIAVERLHGDRSQAQRTRALAGFKSGHFRVLVATDVAARGLDIVALGHVVNYDVPMVPDDYIHRIGRTGRAQATGDAITFVSPDEEKLFTQIERTLGKRLDRAKTPALPTQATMPMPFLANETSFVRKRNDRRPLTHGARPSAERTSFSRPSEAPFPHPHDKPHSSNAPWKSGSTGKATPRKPTPQTSFPRKGSATTWKTTAPKNDARKDFR